jgi:hypothetical protein
MPWAVCTDTGVIDQLANPGSDADQRAYRRLLFGRQTITPSAIAYPSDDVIILPGLDSNLGSQSIQYDEGKGLTGGQWSVSFKREAHSANYDDIRLGAVNGVYDGLDLIPDPAYDGNIATGNLSNEYRAETDSLTWHNDSGLNDAIVSWLASKDIFYLWAGSSCFAISQNPTDNGDGTYTVAAAKVRNGIFRTCRERLFPSDFEGGSILLASAPVGGIVGRPANLWQIPLQDDGTIIDLEQRVGATLDEYPEPILFRTGPVAPGPRGDAGTWKVSCHFWQKWLDVEPPTDQPVGQLKGFRLTRQPSGLPNQVQRAHLSIMEYDSVGATYVETEIWLCAEGGEVYYETSAELMEAVQDELADAIAGTSTFSDQPKRSYAIDFDGMYPFTYPSNETWIGGPIPWILDLNHASTGGIPNFVAKNSRAVWDEYSTEDLDRLNASTNPSTNEYRLITDSSEQFIYKDPRILQQPGYFGQAMYYYQFNFSRAQLASAGNDFITGASGEPPPKITQFPIPKQTTAADYRLEFQDDFDAQLLSTGSKITLGFDTGLGIGPTMQLEGEVQSVGVGYCITSTSDTWDTIPALEKIGGDEYGPPWWACALMYFPDSTADIMKQDRWVVAQNQPVKSASLTKLLRGVLGDEESTGQDMPSRLRVWNIPDLFTDSNYNEDFRNLIDWRKLGTLAQGLFPSSKYYLPLTGNYNILEVLNALMLNHRIRPTWGYSELERAWIMSFEEFGIVSGIQAQQAGRTIDKSSIGTKMPVDTQGDTWLYRDIQGKLNYNSEGAGAEITVKNRTGISSAVGGEKTLKIDDRVLRIPESQINILIGIYRDILAHTNVVAPSTQITCTPRALASTTVGSSILVTHPQISNQFTGTRGVTNLAALCTSVKISFSDRKFNIPTRLRLSALTAQGWGPALRLAGARMSLSGSDITVTGLSTTATENEFADTNGGLTDLATFGCFVWSPQTNIVEESQSCTCGQYRVWILDSDVETYVRTGASKNVWAAKIKGSSTDVITTTDIANGACKIELLDAVESFDDTTEKIVKFADRDNADLQDCQALYGFWGDENGQVQDSGGTNYRAFSWS